MCVRTVWFSVVFPGWLCAALAWHHATQPEVAASEVKAKLGAPKPFDDSLTLPGLLSDPSKHPEIVPPKFQSGAGAIGSFYIGDGQRKVWVAVEQFEGKRLAYVDCNRNKDLSDDDPVVLREEDRKFKNVVRVKTLNGLEACYEIYQMQPLKGMQPMFRRKNGVDATMENSINAKRCNFREGQVELDGTQYKLGLFDWDVDGSFAGKKDLVMIDLNQDDALTLELSSRETHATPKYLSINGLSYGIEIAPSGDSIVFSPAPEIVVDSKSLDVGDLFPMEQLAQLDGSPFSMESLKGKWVLVDFWGEWCGGCVRETPQLIELNQSLSGKKFEIIGFLVTGRLENAKRYIKEAGITWKQILIDGGKAEKDYLVRGYPTKFLLDPTGKIVAVNPSLKEIAAHIK